MVNRLNIHSSPNRWFSGGIAVALMATGWCLYGDSNVNTENAYIKAGKLSLSAEVSAVVSEVHVRANQPVRRGDQLVSLDDYVFHLAVTEAEAHLEQIGNLLHARRANYAEAKTALEQAQQDVQFYRRQQQRIEKMGSLAVSQAQLDESRQQLVQAHSWTAINVQKLTSLRAELGGSPDVPLEEQADLKVAQAKLDRARYQLSRTQIFAPADGVVSNTVPQVGELARNGVTLISLISTESVWVEANLKETQLSDIRLGLQARVEVDAYPGHFFQAEVESLSPASGSEFALIPAQNASGNWVKVVQRIPVRLRLLKTEGGPVLRAGMSAKVQIDTTTSDTTELIGKQIALQL